MATGLCFGWAKVGRQVLRARKSEPASVDAGESPESHLVLLDTELHQIIQIPESPRDSAETRNAEQGIQDLRVDLNPYPTRGVDVVAGRFTHCG